MTGLSLRLSLAFVALTVAATGVSADQTAKKKRKTFFESLFSGPGDGSYKRKKRRGNGWWTNNDVRIIYLDDDFGGTSRRVDDSDPEGDSGYGMGNLTYVADKLVPLGGATLTRKRPAMTAEAAVFDALTDKDLGPRVMPEHRDAILKQYAEQGYRPFWIEAGKLSQRGRDVLKALSLADEEGLGAANYLPAGLAGFDAPPPDYDMAALARLDVSLTAAALLYAHHASGGQFEPSRLSRYHDVKPERADPGLTLKVLAWTPYPVEYLNGLHPSHPAYAGFKKALAELKAESQPAFEPIAKGKIVRVGQSDQRLSMVRARLKQLGYAADAAPDADPLVLDKTLSGILREFQKSARTKVTGVLGNNTIGALNAEHGDQDRARLLANMERLRWLPKSLGHRHVFVNQAAFEVRVMDGDSEAWSSRVIVGKPNTQTAVFNDEIETVVFNPSWGVPPSIIANEYLPKLRNDPGYLDRIGFKVVNSNGKVVRSSSVDWWNYGSRVPFGIQQPPGAKNALGELKFLFPNTHNIYMHDTPNRDLFENEVRAFSHGCVRVQNPREFATILLGWSREKIDSATDSKKSQSIRLERKVPVYIAYFTAWPDESGKIMYYNDIYGRDQAMTNARTALTIAQR